MAPPALPRHPNPPPLRESESFLKYHALALDNPKYGGRNENSMKILYNVQTNERSCIQFKCFTITKNARSITNVTEQERNMR